MYTWSHALSNLQKKDGNLYLSTSNSCLSHTLCQEVSEQSWKYWGQLQGKDELETFNFDLGEYLCVLQPFLYVVNLSCLSAAVTFRDTHTTACTIIHNVTQISRAKVISQFKCVLCNFISVWEVGEKSHLKCQEPDSVVENSSKPHACRIISARLNFTPALSK